MISDFSILLSFLSNQCRSYSAILGSRAYAQYTYFTGLYMRRMESKQTTVT